MRKVPSISGYDAITYWKIRGVMNSAYHLLIDGVHFNEEGFIRYIVFLSQY